VRDKHALPDKSFWAAIPLVQFRRLPGTSPVQGGRTCESCVRFVDGREAMRHKVICFLIFSFLGSSHQQKPTPAAVTPTCHEFSFEGRVNWVEACGFTYHHRWLLKTKIGVGLSKCDRWIARMTTLFLSIPHFILEIPSWLSTGYGETVEQQLKYEHEVFFVLNRTEYEHAAKLVEETMSSSEPEAAGKFIAALPALRSAVLRLRPLKYQTDNAGNTAAWITFGVTVTTPANFRPPSGVNAREIACPSNHL
jgi:hypothetical protein